MIRKRLTEHLVHVVNVFIMSNISQHFADPTLASVYFSVDIAAIDTVYFTATNFSRESTVIFEP